MDKQFRHTILPQAIHDEQARQDFVVSLKMHIAKNIAPGNKKIYEEVVKPKFERENQRPPQNRHEIRKIMQHESHYRWWSSLRRINQEMLWDAVNSSVDRQLPDLISATEKPDKLGSLTLSPNFQIPAYQTVVDIHCMPGGYHTEFTDNDVSAGATYDRGVYVYGMGWLGELNDDMGLSIVKNYLHLEYPEFQPQKILDMGCSVGHSTLPYVDGYPDAEVFAIDIGAPMLRYAHARASALGKRVHFSQQNAEHTNFADGSFDLVVSHILLHEIPAPAIRNVLRESYRLLAPGGMMIHVDAPVYSQMDAFSSFMYDWETANNNEPFWSSMRDLDLAELAASAGFEVEKTIQKFVPNTISGQAKSANNSKQGELSKRGTWFVISSIK
ncbi:MAG: methyltransferase domain-containing protein [Rhizonema sp. NSF051]|nr:methyltransferase domain-containing protein [Rhizonema sp. NSF051]